MNLEILIIDDDPSVLYYHEMMVMESGLSSNPNCFNSPFSALEYLTTNQDLSVEYLIFLDLNMPKMSGWEFLEKLKQNSKIKYKVVIVTSSLSQNDKMKSENYSEIEGFWEKPLTDKNCMSFLEKLKPENDLE